jgi:hypothetical protein
MSRRLTPARIWTASVLLLAGLAVMGLATRPSNDRSWSADQALLPRFEQDGNILRVSGVRNFEYASETNYVVQFEDRAYDLDRLNSLWFVMVPFTGVKAAAHTFVSFGFGDGDFLAVSVEIRKEQGERYSLWRGLFRQYEIMYVVGDERDLIRLRTSVRGDEAYLYPARATPAHIRDLLLDIGAGANRLADQPEFYHTLWNNCTVRLHRHVNRVLMRKVPMSWRVVLPGFADRFACDHGLIDTDLPFEAARAKYRITGRARQFAADPRFSARIREFDAPTGGPARTSQFPPPPTR